MNKSVFFIIFSFIIPNSFAQKLEIGGGAGLTHYKGDLNQIVNPVLTRPAADVFLRYNLNRAVSLSANGFFGSVLGDDRKSNNPFNRTRGFNFIKTVQNSNFQIEYNFLNFRTTSGIVKSSWTPYLFGGYGGFQETKNVIKFNDIELKTIKSGLFSGFQPTFNFGLGFKKVFSSRFNIGANLSIFKTFGKKKGDLFDNLGYSNDKNGVNGIVTQYYPPTGSILIIPSVFQIPNNHLNDTFYYTRFYVSYVFYRTYCPPSKKLKLKKF